MQPLTSKRYYTPQFTPLAAISVRRLAWSLGLSMPATVDIMVKLMPHVVNPSKVCLSCKDKSKCASCAFGSLSTDNQQTAATLEAVM